MHALIAALILICAASPAAWAHAAGTGATRELGWSWEPWVLAGLALASLWYGIGVWRLRGRSGSDRVIGRSQLAAFAGGILVLFLALVSPLDILGEQLFAAHMVQHLLLLLAAAPLLVAGRPAIAFLWAFAPAPRKRVGRIWITTRLGRLVERLMHPVLVWLLFSGAFVFWHMPGPYEWALRNELVHALEHLSFLVTALMFWTIIIEPSGRRRIGYGATLLFVATTAVVSGLPGALIFLAPRPLYPIHAAGAAAWGLTLVEDQEIAGVIMWIPAGLVYLVAVLWVFAQWLREAERRSRLRTRAARLHPAAAILAAALLGGLMASGAARAQSSPYQGEPPSFGGNADRGAALIQKYGCGACHMVPGIAGADGLVGPPLTLIGRRIYIAGLLRNTPDNMMMWLRQPQRIVPGNVMPDMGITAQDARDITAYLYTLR